MEVKVLHLTIHDQIVTGIYEPNDCTSYKISLSRLPIEFTRKMGFGPHQTFLLAYYQSDQTFSGILYKDNFQFGLELHHLHHIFNNTLNNSHTADILIEIFADLYNITWGEKDENSQEN